MQIVHDLYIAGEWIAGNSKAIVSINPATNEVIWQGNVADDAQVALAVNAARKAYSMWMELTLNARCAYLEQFVQCLASKQEELVEVLAQETGKPLWEAKTELMAMLGKLDISKQAFTERCKDVTKDMQGFMSVTRHKPHGVVAVLGPFNFPGHLPNGHIIPALLAGNTIIFKPSELTPLLSIKIMECWHAADLPPGVINMVLGYSDIGKLLVANQNIDAVFFTGSYNVGHEIAKACVELPHRILALEMGGNNPLIVYKPRHLDAAVYLTIQSAYTTAGQRCTCARRLIVVKDKIGIDFVNLLCAAIAKIKYGAYTEQPEPFMGPLISNNAANKVMLAYKTLLDAGAKELVAMRKPHDDLAFLSPGLVDVTNVRVADEEIFGPLLRLIWVDDFSCALQEANNTEYGLSAGLVCEDAELYYKFLNTINAGVVSWNRPTIGSSSAAPFGGLKKSGNYRPSAYYAADYCSYPIASMEASSLDLPETLNPGISL